MNYSKGKFLQM